MCLLDLLKIRAFSFQELNYRADLIFSLSLSVKANSNCPQPLTHTHTLFFKSLFFYHNLLLTYNHCTLWVTV